MDSCRDPPGCRACGHRGAHRTCADASGSTLTGVAIACQLGQARPMTAPQRRVVGLGAAAVAALGAAVLVQAQRHPEQALGGGSAGALALQLAAGLGACAAGADLAIRGTQRRSGALLAASGV